jgi:hypothetical protein
MKNILVSITLTALVFAGFGCTESNPSTEEGAASLKFYLTDAPGEYQQVNIDIQSVRVIMNDSLMEVPSTPGIYNLLDFTNGKDTLIADGEYGEGFVSQIRLVLGDNNTVMVDSVIHDLKTPSAQTSGLKLNVQQEITPGAAYAFTIDFDAQLSIVEKGNGGFNLKPVIRVITEELSSPEDLLGSIQGVVFPFDADSLVSLIWPDDTLTTISDTAGNFMFMGLDPGMYNLDILATSMYADTSLTDIEVLAGETTVVDTVFFE